MLPGKFYRLGAVAEVKQETKGAPIVLTQSKVHPLRHFGPNLDLCQFASASSEILLCSTKTGFGLKELWARILSRAEENAPA